MIHCVCWYNDYCLSIILFPRNNFHIVKPRLQNETLIMYRILSPIHVSWHYLYKNPYFIGTYLEIHDFMNIIDLFCHCKKTLGVDKGLVTLVLNPRYRKNAFIGIKNVYLMWYYVQPLSELWKYRHFFRKYETLDMCSRFATQWTFSFLEKHSVSRKKAYMGREGMLGIVGTTSYQT